MNLNLKNRINKQTNKRLTQENNGAHKMKRSLLCKVVLGKFTSAMTIWNQTNPPFEKRHANMVCKIVHFRSFNLNCISERSTETLIDDVPRMLLLVATCWPYLLSSQKLVPDEASRLSSLMVATFLLLLLLLLELLLSRAQSLHRGFKKKTQGGGITPTHPVATLRPTLSSLASLLLFLQPEHPPTPPVCLGTLFF